MSVDYTEKNKPANRPKLLIPFGITRYLEFTMDKPLIRQGATNGHRFEYYVFVFKDLEDNMEYFKTFSTGSGIGKKMAEISKLGVQIELSCENSLHKSGRHYPAYFVKQTSKSVEELDSDLISDLD